MYKWTINITLKSGVVKYCEYDGIEYNSGDVITKLFNGKNSNEWVSLYSNGQRASTYVVVGEIAAIDICERKK